MSGKMFKTPMCGATMLIDYDDMRISFIYPEYTHDVLLSYKLKRADKNIEYPINPIESVSTNNIQFICKLQAPGEELIAYYKDGDEYYYGITECIYLKMQDGSLWYTDINKDIGLDATLIKEIVNAINSSDHIVEFGDNNSKYGTLFPPYAASINSDSIGIDHKNMTGYIITSSFPII